MKKILLTVLACGAVCAGSAAYAQQPEGPRRIGILSPSELGDPEARAQWGAFVDRIRELGYVEGKSFVIERRFADGKFDRLALLAGELVKAQVDVIVTSGNPATAAARRATATVPIVATTFGDPVASGFAVSLARPGRNVTGFTAMGSGVHEKRLEILAETMPEAKRIGLLVNPDKEFYLRVLPGLQKAADRLQRKLILIKAKDERELQDAIGAMRRLNAVFVGDDPFMNSHSQLIAVLALREKLPVIFPTMQGVEDGGLIGVVNDPLQRNRSAADYVDRILKGEKPGDLPIEQPTRLALALNLKTAAALGIAIPPAVRARADRVIE